MTELRVGRWVVLLGVVAVACGPLADDGGSADAGDGRVVAVEQVPASPREDTASALDDPTADALPRPLLDPNELLAGGPPPDGIPSIDEPKFVRASTATFLEDDEPVLAIEVDGEARTYPI